jgi:hypothetical protein
MRNSGTSMTEISDPKNSKGLDKAEPKEKHEPKRQLAGSAALIGDLEKASAEIADSVIESVARSGHEINDN